MMLGSLISVAKVRGCWSLSLKEALAAIPAMLIGAWPVAGTRSAAATIKMAVVVIIEVAGQL
jgi:hypothetical protein